MLHVSVQPSLGQTTFLFLVSAFRERYAAGRIISSTAVEFIHAVYLSYESV